ncbi:MAG: hypothetical protein HY754_16105 [Nitrospirae bacterium]|nr:hypothetical protein [Nitrospirota bacterium]
MKKIRVYQKNSLALKPGVCGAKMWAVGLELTGRTHPLLFLISDRLIYERQLRTAEPSFDLREKNIVDSAGKNFKLISRARQQKNILEANEGKVSINQ